jgi:hypothetical protein
LNPQTGEFITVSPDIAASCTCPELLRACLIYVDDYGGNLLSESSKALLEPLRSFARGAGRDVCAAPSMDIWAAAVLSFELMRTAGGEEGKEGVALFGSKMEVSSWSTQRLLVSLWNRNFNRSHIVQRFFYCSFLTNSSFAPATTTCVQSVSDLSYTTLMLRRKKLLVQRLLCRCTL